MTSERSRRTIRRRDFLAVPGKAIAGATLLSSANLVQPTYAAITPTVVAQIVSTGLGIAGIFGGDSTQALLKLQAEMLQKISQQLNVIQLGIVQILKQLDEVKRLIGDVPDAVALKLYENEMNALMTDRYAELMDEYRTFGYPNRSDDAKTKWLHTLEVELLRPMRRARDLLMVGIPDTVSLVPIICSASVVETHAMAYAAYSKERMLPAIKSYRNWIATVLDKPDNSINARIAATRKDRESTLKETPDNVHGFKCLKGNSEKDRPPALPGVEMFGTVEDIDYYYDYANPLTLPNGFPPEVTQAVKAMTDQKILKDDELPTLGWGKFATNSYTVQQGVASLPICGPITAARQAQISELSDKLTTQGYQLMSLRSMQTAASAGIAFLDTLSHRFENLPA